MISKQRFRLYLRPRGYRGSGGGLASYPERHEGTSRRAILALALALLRTGRYQAADVYRLDDAPAESVTGLGSFVAIYSVNEAGVIRSHPLPVGSNQLGGK